MILLDLLLKNAALYTKISGRPGTQKVAKAYGVFMDEELNEKYHFFLDHPVSHALSLKVSSGLWLVRRPCACRTGEIKRFLFSFVARLFFFSGTPYVHVGEDVGSIQAEAGFQPRPACL